MNTIQEMRWKLDSAIRDTLVKRTDLTYRQIAEFHGVSLAKVEDVHRRFRTTGRKPGPKKSKQAV